MMHKWYFSHSYPFLVSTSSCFRFGLLTKRKYVYILLIMKEQHHQEVNTDLAQQLVMDRTTLTRNLTLLEHRGLVAIAMGDDQRTRLVTLTNQGREALMKALLLWNRRRRVSSQNWDAHTGTRSSRICRTRCLWPVNRKFFCCKACIYTK